MPRRNLVRIDFWARFLTRWDQHAVAQRRRCATQSHHSRHSADATRTPTSRCLPLTCLCRLPPLGLGVWVARRVTLAGSANGPLLGLVLGWSDMPKKGGQHGRSPAASSNIPDEQ